jgi:hypothetical protein
MIHRGLSVGTQYLFVIDGAKALKKAIKDRFGTIAHESYSRNIVISDFPY